MIREQQPGLGADDRDRVIHFVRDLPGQLADGGELLSPDHLRLGSLLLGDILSQFNDLSDLALGIMKRSGCQLKPSPHCSAVL